MSDQIVLLIIAIAAKHGADAALCVAIEAGLVEPDHHTDSPEFKEAKKEAKNW